MDRAPAQVDQAGDKPWQPVEKVGDDVKRNRATKKRQREANEQYLQPEGPPELSRG